MIRRIRAEVTREVSAFRREGQESRWLATNRTEKNQRPSSGEPGPCQCHFLPQEIARLIPLPEGRLLAPQKIKCRASHGHGLRHESGFTVGGNFGTRRQDEFRTTSVFRAVTAVTWLIPTRGAVPANGAFCRMGLVIQADSERLLTSRLRRLHHHRRQRNPRLQTLKTIPEQWKTTRWRWKTNC